MKNCKWPSHNGGALRNPRNMCTDCTRNHAGILGGPYEGMYTRCFEKLPLLLTGVLGGITRTGFRVLNPKP